MKAILVTIIVVSCSVLGWILLIAALSGNKYAILGWLFGLSTAAVAGLGIAWLENEK